MDGIKYLLKFGKRPHVKEFAEGSLYCSDAVTFWGIENKLKLRGQGDILEAGSRMFAQRMMITEHGTNNTTVINMKANGLVHIDPAKHMPVFCMFAVNEKECSVDKNGKSVIILPEKVKQAIREHFPNADSVGIIKDPDAFLHDVEDSIGCEVKHEMVHYFHIDNEGEGERFCRTDCGGSGKESDVQPSGIVWDAHGTDAAFSCIRAYGSIPDAAGRHGIRAGIIQWNGERKRRYVCRRQSGGTGRGSRYRAYRRAARQ